MRDVMLFLPLHASVLKPDFDLALAQVEHVRDLNATTARQITVEVKFFLQLKRLMSRVRRPRTLAVRAVSFHCTATHTHTHTPR